MVSDEILCSVRNIAEYLHDEEERHYLECDERGRRNHIFHDVKNVMQWLNSESDLPTKTCPRCKKVTLEIHGEGITSDNRHYPLEQCTNCNYPDAP